MAYTCRCPCRPTWLEYFAYTTLLQHKRYLICREINALPPLRFVSANRVVMRRVSPVGSQAFLVAGPQTWNDLQEDVKQNH